MSRGTTALSGAVLAGGRSRRMGRDKARLRVGGQPLWERQINVLRAAGAQPVVMVRRAGQPVLARAIPTLRDAMPDAGPMAGLQVAIAETGAALVAVLAVDMPEVDAAWFQWLRGCCRAECGAVVRHADGYEPLAAIYPRGALLTITRRLRRGEHSLQALVAALVRAHRMTVVPLPENERWRVANWNRPSDRTTAVRSRAT